MNIRKAYLVFIFSFFILWASTSYATSCDKEFLSVERAYIAADVVFSGYTEPSQNIGLVHFKVSEVFKHRNNQENITKQNFSFYHETKAHPLNFDEGVEYIVYANYANSENDELIIVPPCLKTKIAPEEHIRLLKLWSEDPSLLNEKTGESIRLIFKGRAVQIDAHRKLVKPPFIGRERKQSVGTVNLDILEMYKGDELFDAGQKTGRIAVDVGQCVDGYKFGEEYIIFGQSLSVSKDKSEANTRADCMPTKGPIHMAEKKVLRELEKSYVK